MIFNFTQTLHIEEVATNVFGWRMDSIGNSKYGFMSRGEYDAFVEARKRNQILIPTEDKYILLNKSDVKIFSEQGHYPTGNFPKNWPYSQLSDQIILQLGEIFSPGLCDLIYLTGAYVPQTFKVFFQSPDEAAINDFYSKVSKDHTIISTMSRQVVESGWIEFNFGTEALFNSEQTQKMIEAINAEDQSAERDIWAEVLGFSVPSRISIM